MPTALVPYARLVSLTDNSVIATTSSLVKGSITRTIDKAGARSISVPLSDPGDAIDDASGFVNALLAATGGSDITSAPAPTLLELSLDGGTTIDARWVVKSAVPDLTTGQLLITCSGDDTSSLYGTVGPNRFATRDVALADVLGGILDTVTPLDSAHYGISTDGKIQGFEGLLRTIPGNDPIGTPMWDADAQAHFSYTGVISNALSSAIAFLGVNIDAWEDTSLRLLTSLVKILAGVFFATDTVDQGSRGHAVWCDSDVNLSGDIAGVVCDGTPTIGSPAGADGYSNDATNHPTGIPNAVVIGNVGGDPRGHAFTFDASASTPLAPSDEPTTARLFADQTSLQPDLSPLYGKIRLTGGSNDAGLLPSETITCLITLNNKPADDEDPTVAWTDVLPLIGTNLSDQTGGLYFDAGDGQLRRIPSWNLAAPIYDMTVNNQDGILYVATSQGVYWHSTTDIATSTANWARLGGLAYKVIDLVGLGVDTNFLLYALVANIGNGQDAIYQYNHDSPATAGTNGGYTDWSRFFTKEKIVSFTAVSDNEIFFLTQADQQASLHYYNAADGTTPRKAKILGAGVTGIRVDRVHTAGTPGQDSVWIATQGDSQPGYYLLYNGADWMATSLQQIDADGSLATAVETAAGLHVEPQINRAVPLGYGIGAKADGTDSVTVAVMLCTQAGVYYMADPIPDSGGADWSAQANGLNGLAGISITDLVAGQPTQLPNPYKILTDPYVTVTRMYAISGTVFFYSYSSSQYWRDLLREPLVLGDFFYQLVFDATADLPSYAVQTVGPMASSPIGGPTESHVQITARLPTGWYWRREWNACYEPYYALVNGNVPWPQVYDEQISEVAVSPSVNLPTASADLATFFIMLLGEHSTRQTTVTVQSSFQTQESGLRYLWPTHQVAVTQQGLIKILASDGETLVTTTYINLSNSPMFVLEHTISWEGSLFQTQTVLSPSVRGTPQTGADFAAALVSDLRRIRVHGLRKKRQ